jgi:hypothetical protein
MATNFPASVDTLTNPVSNDSLNSPSHSAQHANANDAIEAIETYLLGGGQGLTFIKKQTIGTAVATITVTNAFSAIYENYKVIVTNTDGSLVDEGILVKFNNVSGTTYHRTFAFVNNTTGVVTGVAAAGVNTGITVGFCATSNGSFMFDVYTPFTTTTTSVTGFASQGSGNGLIGCSGQDRYVASQTGFDLVIAGGSTLTGGTIYVFGYGIGT